MTTAAEYRKYAQECIDCARDATTDPIREQFLEIAKLWLTAASPMDIVEKSPGQSKSKTDGPAPPGPAVAE